MRNTFINTIIDTCRLRDDIFIISGDAGLGVFDEFKDNFPDRFLNLGVAEQNTIGFAAGLCMAGHKVIVYNIVPFLLYRCYEQVRNDICYQKLPIVLAGIGCGLTYAPQGMTHYSIEDIGIARSLPNLAVISPADPVEAGAAAMHALEASQPVYVRLAKRGEPNLHANTGINIAQPQVLSDGPHVAIVCHGPITETVLEAGSLLRKTGITPRIISLPMLQPLNVSGVLDLLDDIALVVSVEEHQVTTGLGAILLDAFSAGQGVPFEFRRLGLPARFIHDIGDTADLRKLYSLDAHGIAKSIRTFLPKNPNTRPLASAPGENRLPGEVIFN